MACALVYDQTSKSCGIASAHIPLTGTQSHDHTPLWGRKGELVGDQESEPGMSLQPHQSPYVLFPLFQGICPHQAAPQVPEV